MSSIWTAVIAGGAAIGSGLLASNAQSKAADKASKISQQASGAQLEFLRQQSNQAREDQLPYSQGGASAFGEFLKQLGVPLPAGYGKAPNAIDVASGRGTYGSRLVALPGITTTGVHSKQTNTSAGAIALRDLSGAAAGPLGYQASEWTNNLLGQGPEVKGGKGGGQLYYDPGSHTIVDAAGQLVSNVPQSGRIAGLVSGFNNPVEINNGTLYGVGSHGSGSLNLNLTPLTDAEKAAYGKSDTTTSGTGGNDRYGAFFASPGYQFLYDEAMRGARANGAARGSLYSGAMLKELQNRATGLASQEYGNYMNRLYQASGLGQAAAAGTAANAQNLGTTGATILGNAASDRANAQLISGASTASSIMGGNTALQGTLGTLLDYYKTRSTPASVSPNATTGFTKGGAFNFGYQ